MTRRKTDTETTEAPAEAKAPAERKSVRLHHDGARSIIIGAAGDEERLRIPAGDGLRLTASEWEAARGRDAVRSALDSGLIETSGIVDY